MNLSWQNRLLIVAAYVGLLVYGTWFPLDRWDWSLGGLQPFLAMDWPQRISRPDLVINVVVYVPLGALLSALLQRGQVKDVLAAGVLGFLLSATLEYGQTYLPGRVTSGSDLVLNTMGAMAGALAGGFLLRSSWIHHRYSRVVAELRHPGIGRLGLLILALWVLSQWAPWVPSLDLSNLKHGIAPFRSISSRSEVYFILRCCEYFAMLVGLLALGLHLFRDREAAARWLVIIILAVLLGKVIIMTRMLSPEALLAWFAATAVAVALRGFSSSWLQLIGLITLLSYHLMSALIPETTDLSLRKMNWLPFRGQMNSISGIIDLVGDLWLFAAYAYLMYPRRHRSSEGLALRLALLAPWTLLLEASQQLIPGRYPDITDVAVGLIAFVLCYSYPWRHKTRNKNKKSGSVSGFRAIPKWRRAMFGTAVATALLVGLGQLDSEETRTAYRLPDPDELANPKLEDFRYRHPRLPAPGSESWSLLQRENPTFIQKIRRRAEEGDLYSRILLARSEPAGSDLSTLFNDLMALEFAGRGHEQTIPIALAYDWLHGRLSSVQQERLLQKTAQACEYQIEVISDKMALSPYNVYLYNSPLQALMMAGIASYGDSTDGRCMSFTHDYWKNRVLPVWRQVMGRRGGWHEGGEYVGIGIGKAIYRLPAMWRRATGEDLFATHPGIRGFPDFALQRVRPDGTSMRLGDTGYVDNPIPDLAPLALELRHSAAYTAASPPVEPTPLGFPWGPLSDATLLEPRAKARQPLSTWFDGIGLLIARSDWSEDATYLTVKAGNNYWSHTHLDQGAFTLFKGGALAIDSGVYFDSGGEHHVNYTYQSVAHNVVTVTDPQDIAPLPGEPASGSQRQSPDQPIANDGGQRRVGSRWGRPAPLDLSDWRAQRDEYQTVGKVMVDSDLADSMVWLNADLTPAYTNDHSADGEFQARTRRVDEYRRSLVYLHDMDVVLIHDRLRLSKSDLRSRWLLHSQNEPHVSGNRFEVRAGRGELRGQVLLPRQSTIQRVGGPGMEFFVDGHNYDQEGKALKWASSRPTIEPGAWRLEVQPDSGSFDLEYLIALELNLSGDQQPQLTLGVEELKNSIEVTLNAETKIRLPKAISEIRKLTRYE